MKILLICHPAPAALAESSLSWEAFQSWTEPAPAFSGHDSMLAARPGQGATILCSPQPTAVAAAQKLYPDRRIEVKTLYREPLAPPPRLPWLRLRPHAWQRLGRLWWTLGLGPGPETHEALKRRIIDTSIRLTEIAKQSDEAVLLAGPALLRRVALKLVSIGWKGEFLRAYSWGDERSFDYLSASAGT